MAGAISIISIAIRTYRLFWQLAAGGLLRCIKPLERWANERKRRQALEERQREEAAILKQKTQAEAERAAADAKREEFRQQVLQREKAKADQVRGKISTNHRA